MSIAELSVLPERNAGLATNDRGYLGSQDVLARMTRILEIQKTVMKVNVHFGTIPGTQKPTLLKPGAEKLLVTFQIAGVPTRIEDLSVPGEEVRYRVHIQGVSQVSGVVLGEAAGECSSNEEKYRWRKPVCDEEYDETPEDMRRAVWKKYQGTTYKAKQIRTSPADVANTILQMATKRALVPMTKTVLACSDIFEQDLEDMPAELRESLVEQDQTAAPAMQEPQRRQPATDAAPPANGGGDAPAPNGDYISEKQAKRFWVIARDAGITGEALKAWLQREIGIDDERKITRRAYDDVCAAVGAGPR